VTTAREGILAALATLAGTVPGATFYRSREAAVARSEGSAIVLAPEDEPVELRTAASPVALRNLTALFTILARGEIPDQVADPIIESLHRKLMADRTLGGLCALLTEHSTKWTYEVADLTAAAIEIRYVVRYATSAIDLSLLT
jgi:hypothetical protein